MNALGDALQAALAGVGEVAVAANVSLAERTTLKVGGAAAALVTVESTTALAKTAQVCADMQVPILLLGRGSNVLIADAGWPGAVVVLGRGFRGVEFDDVNVTAGAAEPMPVLARTVAAHGLGGLAFGVAIPGSLGGAVRMNAGAHGREMRDVLRWAEVVRLGSANPAVTPGLIERVTVDQLSLSYRHSDLPADAVVVAAGLQLEHEDTEALDAQMAEMKQWRRDHQPINEPSCGSVFRNPEGDSAGRLIEAAGMKGYRVGGATVSQRHANFITVASGATASDVYGVITAVRAAVAERCGVSLNTEVVLAGFDDVAGTP